ncbi:MAG: fibronectin type III domain-containing protein [Actinobacteria bacterium]|nr:fibronectin type III domain-containing protein [Actinomycetota bacterium]
MSPTERGAEHPRTREQGREISGREDCAPAGAEEMRPAGSSTRVGRFALLAHLRGVGGSGAGARRLLLPGLLMLAFLLVPATQAFAVTLTVNLSGSGKGRVTTADGSINCSNIPGQEANRCSYEYGFATAKLEATPAPEDAFLEWGPGVGQFGSCTAFTNPCETSFILSATEVTADFKPQPDLPSDTEITGVSAVTDGSVELEGRTNPNSTSFPLAECQFEFGETSSYGRSSICEQTVGPGTAAVPVSAMVARLKPATTYHFRLTARNAGGIRHSADATFTTSPPANGETCPNAAVRLEQASVFLPECRAYEKVTPDYKQSSNPLSAAFPMAADGDGISWKQSGNYDGEGSSLGQGTYIARRTPDGWQTVNVSAPFRLVQQAGLLSVAPRFSADLSTVTWCLGQNESAGMAQEQEGPFACAVRDPGGQWLKSPSLEDVRGASIGGAYLAGASADLSHLVISSNAHFLSSAGAATRNSLYEFVDPELADPSLRLINVDNNGALIGPGASAVLGGETSTYQAVSADGSTIFFTTTPTGGVATIYARVDGTTTTAVSNPSPPECTSCNPTAKAATYIGASSDGRRVFFVTAQQLVNQDTDTGTNCSASVTAGCDLYEYDFEEPSGSRIVQVSGGGSGDLTPGVGAEVQGVTQVSQDGSHVYFLAKGVLTTVPNAAGQVPSTGASNLYVYERDAAFPLGRTRFIATVPTAEASTLVGGNSPAQVTPDGRYLVFATAAQLITSGPEADTDSAIDVYRYDSATGRLSRVSIGEPGYPASDNGNTPGMNAVLPHAGGIGALSEPGFGQSETRSRLAAISDDGSYVVFETAEKLQADDVNGGSSASNCTISGVGCDVYLWHDGTVRMLSDSPLPDPGGANPVLAPGISASGRDVFFSTSGRLTPTDLDNIEDTYDARIDGGFSATPMAQSCTSGDSCQGPPTALPAAPVTGTPGFLGPGNPSPASPGHHKKKHHKKKHHKNSSKHKAKGKQKKRAHRNRGGAR